MIIKKTKVKNNNKGKAPSDVNVNEETNDDGWSPMVKVNRKK